MSFFTNLIIKIDNALVPKDGLYDQARDVIAHFDKDGDTRINVSALTGDNTPPPGILGIAGRGFHAADDRGNGNGYASIREVRNVLKGYDTGNPFSPDSAGDKHIDGIELLRLLGDFAQPWSTSAGDQAASGASQLA